MPIVSINEYAYKSIEINENINAQYCNFNVGKVNLKFKF